MKSELLRFEQEVKKQLYWCKTRQISNVCIIIIIIVIIIIMSCDPLQMFSLDIKKLQQTPFPMRPRQLFPKVGSGDL